MQEELLDKDHGLKREQIRATPQQRRVLQAAFDRNPDCTKELETLQFLQSETGLTGAWIRAWFGRTKKKDLKVKDFMKREASQSDLQDHEQPAKKKIKLSQTPTLSVVVESPAAAVVSAQDISSSKTSSPLSQIAAPTPEETRRGSSISGDDGQHVLIPDMIHTFRPQIHPTPTDQHSQLPGSVLANIGPSIRGVSDRVPEHLWSKPPPKAHYYHNMDLTVRGLAATSAYSTPVSVLRPALRGSPFYPRTHQRRQQAIVQPSFSSSIPVNSTLHHQTTPVSTSPSFHVPTMHHQTTPVSTPPSFHVPTRYTSPLLTPSRLRPLIPEHIVTPRSVHKSTFSPNLNTPVDDQNLFKSMLNLTPNVSNSPDYSDLFNIDKAPLKHLPVIHRTLETATTLDELFGPLLDDDLPTNDPFQAAMGLVFMSRAGLEWEQ